MSPAAYSLTTSIVPPAASDLTTLATWKRDWQVAGKADDDFIGRTIRRCSASVSQYCNRQFGIATYQDVVRPERGYRVGSIVRGNRDPIMLGRWPLVSITTATEIEGATQTVLSPGSDYEVDLSTSRLYRLDGNGNPRDWPTSKIVIVYMAGYTLPGQQLQAGASPLPDDIEDAVGRMVWSRYAERRRDPFVSEESVVGVGSTKFITPGVDGNMSPDVIDILGNYRVILAG